jgi:hypothetical protein
MGTMGLGQLGGLGRLGRPALSEGVGVSPYSVVNRDGAYVKNRDGARIIANPTPRTS